MLEDKFDQEILNKLDTKIFMLYGDFYSLVKEYYRFSEESLSSDREVS